MLASRSMPLRLRRVQVLSLLFTWGVAAGRTPGDLSGPWQLFVDDGIVAEKSGLVRRYHAFEKHPANPVLRGERPWEGSAVYVYGTVLPGENGRGYRMWYHGAVGSQYRNLYATSGDGLTWERPALGLIEHEGSKANNLFLQRTREDHMPQVIFTPWEQEPGRRYKLINYDYGRTKPDHLIRGYWAAYSADGIHWTDLPNNPVLPDVGDVGNLIWDPHAGKYALYTKVYAPVSGYRRRSIGLTRTDDFESWKPAELILMPDKFDDRWVQHDQQRTDFYGLSAFAYESAYLGFLWVFRITDGKNGGPIFVELVSSRDGVNWRRQEGERRPILAPGEPGAWDGGMVLTPNHPLVEGDTIKLFYGGTEHQHGARAATYRSAIGLATLRKDGFASLDAGAEGGRVSTKLLRHVGGELRVNATFAAGGWLKAELAGRDGRVIPGYSFADSESVAKDGVDQLVSWRRHARLPDGGQILSIRFSLQNASLYSFRAGDGVQLADEEKMPDTRVDFEGDEWRRHVSLAGKAEIAADAERRSTVLVFKSNGATGELPGTAHLGRDFTLAARVRSSQSNRWLRIFSTYRGTGDFVSGELVFDVHLTAGAVRFIANGQRVMSVPRYCGDRLFHHYAVTHANGDVALYMDGVLVGRGRIRQGTTHLFTGDAVIEHLGPESARSDVGLHLAGDLRIGADIPGGFLNQAVVVSNPPAGQLVGAVDDVVVARRVLTPAEIQALAR